MLCWGILTFGKISNCVNKPLPTPTGDRCDCMYVLVMKQMSFFKDLWIQMQTSATAIRKCECEYLLHH